MKRRRGRRGFWWWSWLLLVTAVGGTLGGAFFGKKQWEKADKDYPSTAIVKVDIRAPFSAPNQQQSPSGVANVNEAQVLQQIESYETLSAIANQLDLSQKWGLGMDEVVAELRSSVDLELRQEKREMRVTVVRPDPQESADLANTIGKKIPEVIKANDAANAEEGLKKLKQEEEPYLQSEEEARMALKNALADMNVNLDPKPGVDLNIYLTVPTVAEAKDHWDTVRQTLVDFRLSQGKYERYWQTPLKPSLLTAAATPAPTFTGPEVQPFQVQFGLYGLTLGLFGGLGLMAIFWKLFP